MTQNLAKKIAHAIFEAPSFGPIKKAQTARKSNLILAGVVRDEANLEFSQKIFQVQFLLQSLRELPPTEYSIQH